jgi:hypothetical protein
MVALRAQSGAAGIADGTTGGLRESFPAGKDFARIPRGGEAQSDICNPNILALRQAGGNACQA